MNRNLEPIFQEMEAEDRAVGRLWNLPPKVAAATAVKAAVELAAAWECEMSEMLRRDDPRPVYLSTAEERYWLHSEATKYGEDPIWQSCPAAEIIHELSVLPADAAAFVAYKIAQFVVRRSKYRSRD